MLELSAEDGQFQVFFILCLVFPSAGDYSFNQLYPLTPLMEKLYACKKLSKTKVIRRNMEALAPHTGAPTVHWEDNTIFISVVEAETVNPRVKHIGIPACFLQ